MALLRLGSIDANSKVDAATIKAYLAMAQGFTGFPIPDKLNDDDRNHLREERWVGTHRIKTDEVRELTHFLQDAGFMPHAVHDGFFGYVTQASVRLFQEYVRTRDPDYNPKSKGQAYCHPDGIVGNGTKAHIERWKKRGRVAYWGADAGAREAKKSKVWRDAFLATAEHLRANPGPIQEARARFTRKTDSLPIEDWTFTEDEPLLFGVRRLAHVDNHVLIRDKRRRPTDDLFVLLINGHSFVFYGSTDPSFHQSRKDEPYLIEGQHLYQYSWHKVSEAHKTYRALRPAKHGVVVIRDKTGADALTPENISMGPEQKARHDINIHWSGIGQSNFSAGCQVIGGSGYIDDIGHFRSCRGFAAGSYETLGKPKKGGHRRTKAAYNLMADLLLVYTKQKDPTKRPTLRYTLFSAGDIEAGGKMTRKKLKAIRKKFD